MQHNAEEHPSIRHVRPRFEIETTHSVEQLAQKIKSDLNKESSPIKGRIQEGYATLYLPHEEQHYWSPQLRLSLEKTENGSLLRGLYGPRPSVWTMFVFFYSLIAFAIMVISIIGLSNITLDKSGAILWLVPVLILVFLSLYFVSYSGQKMGQDQMVTLHDFVEKSIGERI